jgi:hypothetical protein
MEVLTVKRVKDATRHTRAYRAAKKLKKAARDTAYGIVCHGIAHIKELMGAESKFCIRGAYNHRTEAIHFDDTGFTDEYQKEVYLYVADLARNENITTIYDVGCGSGYKLINYLGKYDTTGFEVPQTLEFLRRTYPDRKWTSAQFSDRSYPPADLVICSDVIEHVVNPDELMGFLVSLTRKWLVISTPDRDLTSSRLSPFQLGPPATWFHIREWTFGEFRRYVHQFVDIQEHLRPNLVQATQMIVARKR